MNMYKNKTHLAGEEIDYPKQVKQEVNVLCFDYQNIGHSALLIHITIMSTLLHWKIKSSIFGINPESLLFLEGWLAIL